MARAYNNTELTFLDVDTTPPCLATSTTFAGSTTRSVHAMSDRKARFMLSLSKLTAAEKDFKLKDLCYEALRHQAVYNADPKLRWMYNELQNAWCALRLDTEDLLIEQYGLKVWRKPTEGTPSKDLFVMSSQAPLPLTRPVEGVEGWTVLKDHLFDLSVNHKEMVIKTGLNIDKLDDVCGQLHINVKEPHGTIDAEYNLVIKGTFHLGLYPNARLSGNLHP